MIRIGMNNAQKLQCVTDYCIAHDIKKVFLLSPERFVFSCDVADCELIEWSQIIEYKPFYRLLQEIDNSTLVVVNECLRTQNRHDLTYNCIRHFLNQTRHQIVFQYLPLIDDFADFMILLDFDTRSRWKRTTFNRSMLSDVDISITPAAPMFSAVPVTTTSQLIASYKKEKRKLIDDIGLKDPHTIPRNLLLLAGKAKAAHVGDRWLVGRNNRFKLDRLLTFGEPAYPDGCSVFEFCHNFVDFAGFLALSRQTDIPVLLTDLKVDHWYFDRYTAWSQRIQDAYAAIQQ